MSQQSDLYVSDCVNVYDVGDASLNQSNDSSAYGTLYGPSFASQQQASQNCVNSTQDILNNCYQYAGSCANVSSDYDSTYRYISDGTNYFSMSGGFIGGPGQGPLDDHASPSNACSAPHNTVLSAGYNKAVLNAPSQSVDVAVSQCNCGTTAPTFNGYNLCPFLSSECSGETAALNSGALVGGNSQYVAQSGAIEPFSLSKSSAPKIIVILVLLVVAIALGYLLIRRLRQ